jgi:signal transduction histidine kinase
MSFRYRLVLFLVVTLVAIQALAATFAYIYLRESLIERGKQELMAEMGVFTRQLEFLSERVTDAVKVLSLDYALRSAIAQHDHDTELSALGNHGRRIGATRMMLVGLDGRVSADTASPAESRGAFPMPALLEQAAAQDKGTALASFGGRIYWVVTVPVRAPVPIAFIAAFIPVDGILLEKLRAISAEPRTIVLATRASGSWHVAAQSQVRLHQVDLPTTANPPASAANETSENGNSYLTVSARLSTAKGSAPIVAILSYPIDEALGVYRSIIVPLSVVLSLALLAAICGAMVVVRGVSRPLELLAASAKRIAAGDYRDPLRIARRDEIGHLADALANMTESIAERENALKGAVEATEMARQEAVRANNAKSQFLANMSHELRTPLNAIVGFSEMLEQQVLGPLGVPRYKDYAHDIRASGAHLLGLVERMLDLAQAHSQGLSLAQEAIWPAQLLRESVLALKPFADKSRVRVCLEDAFEGCPPIKGDAVKLRQALMNLIHNGIKFTPADGHVRISGYSDRKQLAIRIVDDGIGMQPEILHAVIRPFHRLRSALDGQHQGAGLGLPFAKLIVELHGGELSIQSAPGAGTTISVQLPLASAMCHAA